MAANGQGVAASRKVDLAFYDKLPSELRAILRDAPMALSAEEIDRFRKRGLDDAELADEIRSAECLNQSSLR